MYFARRIRHEPSGEESMKLILLATGLAFGLAFVPPCPASSQTLFEQARDSVIGACSGDWPTTRECSKCIALQIDRLLGDDLITRQLATQLRNSFRSECRDRCVRTSCFVEGRACGIHPDGCGGEMTCGPSCGTAGPNLQICVCGSLFGTQVDMCTTVNCDSGPEQDAFCESVCAPLGGTFATGCIFAEPVCTQ
jgi:hypothetical protein